jgi:polysaccharide export outer membrane protein
MHIKREVNAMRNTRTIRTICSLILLFTAITLSAQAPTFQERHPRYRIQAGDVLALSFTFTPEFNQTITVQPDGYINLRGVGDVRIQDQTTPEVVQTVRTAYTGVLRDPVITVELKEFEKPYFVVGGEVTRPGKFDLRGDTTLAQAVTMAGGLSDRAKSTELLLFRRVSKYLVEVKRVDLKRVLRGEDLTEDLHLVPGDMILVPRTTMSKIARYIPLPSLGAYINPIQH